jgi:lipid-A-disaccharide synthase
MIGAAQRLADRAPGLRCIAAIANQRVGAVFQTALQRFDQGQASAIQAFEGRVRTVIGAADVVLCASGTATLETMLVNRPMVVAYRLAPATYHLAKGLRLVKRQWFALPNILAGERLVPELIQAEVTAERLAREARHWLTDTHAREVLHARFDALGRELRCDASNRAADAVAAVLGAAR